MEDAQRLLQKLAGNSPVSYSDAVALCFRSLGYDNAQLLRNDFKNAVYEKILRPLEETLKSFCGVDSLEKAFEEQMFPPQNGLVTFERK